MYQGYTQLVDSGALYDSTISGGRLGVFQFGEYPVIWSYLQVKCLEHLNQGLYLDGLDDFVELDNITKLRMEDRYDQSMYQGSHKLWKSWKTWKITKKVPCMEKSLNLENLNNHGKVMKFCEII